MLPRYSIFSLVRNALSYHENWPRAWRSPEPKPSYDVVIVGGGGHGLATAYYLAKIHGITNVAVIERGWLGGGNTGRNTTVVRSNYLWDESAALYEHALKLWEGLCQELNFNVMFSQRGVMNLAHNQHDLRELQRRINANRLNGVDSEFLSPREIKSMVPAMDLRAGGRYPVLGASLQRRGGTARHDAVAWGYARAADALGVNIIQECPVTGFQIENGQIQAVETAKGTIRAGKVGVVVAGHCSVLAGMAGFRLPVTSMPLQALVSEPVKPILDTVVMSGAVHAYISQSDKGELVIGAGTDSYVGYGQRGSLPVTEETLAAVCELFPSFRRMRMLRQWGGIVDTCPDASPILSKTPIDGLFFNCGWGTGGFKATPGSGWAFAHTLAKGEPHALNAAFSLDRFRTGYLIDEHGAAARGALSERVRKMLLIPCPHCGPRCEIEFTYGGQAHIARPQDPAATSDEDWASYVFLRDNTKGVFLERWVHAHGCRKWFNVARNTVTYEILTSYEAGAKPPKLDLETQV